MRGYPSKKQAIYRPVAQIKRLISYIRGTRFRRRSKAAKQTTQPKIATTQKLPVVYREREREKASLSGKEY